MTDQNALVPVEGPADIYSMWPTLESRGKDWKISRRPLGVRQMRQLESCFIQDVQIGDKLGSGSFGEVYECTAFFKLDENMSAKFGKRWHKMKFALKIIRHRSITRKGIEISLNDIRILRYLRHENICNYIEFIGIPDKRTGFPYGAVCIFFELCDGNLLDLIAQNQSSDPNDWTVFSLSESLSRHWFAQIARAILYLHDQGIVHRDMKEANILYQCKSNKPVQTFEDKVYSSVFKVADFGLSRDIRDALNQGITEQWTESQHISAKNFDLNILGNILFKHGITKQEDDPDLPEFRYGMLIDTDPLQWKGISDELKDLLLKLENVSKQTENLFSTNELVNHQWLQMNSDPRTEPYIYRNSQQGLW